MSKYKISLEMLGSKYQGIWFKEVEGETLITVFGYTIRTKDGKYTLAVKRRVNETIEMNWVAVEDKGDYASGYNGELAGWIERKFEEFGKKCPYDVTDMIRWKRRDE